MYITAKEAITANSLQQGQTFVKRAAVEHLSGGQTAAA